MMVPEPENEFDEFAVAIKTLSGDQLGYVPREINQSSTFQTGTLFGHIKSWGQAGATRPALYGATVQLFATQILTQAIT